MDNRLTRIEDFKKFKDEAENIFRTIAENDHSHKHLDEVFSLYIAPGGRMGGSDEKVIEVFYGSRTIGRVTTIGENFQQRRRREVENGAALHYSLTDAGNVVCTLYPAKSDNRRPIEDSILFEYIKSPSSLRKKATSHWKAFLSYMEVTCLDGNPSLIQQSRVIYLRNFKQCIIDNTVQARKVSVLLKEVFKYVLTIGLSGFLILVFTLARDDIKKNQDDSWYHKIQLSLDAISQTTSNMSKNIERSECILQELINLEKLNSKSIGGISIKLEESRELLRMSLDELKNIESNLDNVLAKYLKDSTNSKTTRNTE